MQLKTRQVCFIFIAFLPVLKVFFMPSFVSGAAGEDGYLSVFFCCLLDLLTLAVLLSVTRRTGKTFSEILSGALGKVGKNTVLALYLLFFLVKSVIPVCEQQDFVELTLYETMPSAFYFLPFFLVSFYLCVKPLRMLGRCADVTVFCTVLGFVIILALSVSHADFSALLPVGARGGKVFYGSFTVLNWFGDGAYFLFLIGKFDRKRGDEKKIMFSFIISSVIIIFFTATFYAVFKSLSYRQLFAFSEMSKYSTVINYLGRFDYVGIAFILFSTIFAQSLPLFFATEVVCEMLSLRKKFIPALIINALSMAFSLIFGQYFAGIVQFILSFGTIYLIIIGNILPLLLPLLLRLSGENTAVHRLKMRRKYLKGA